MFYRFLLFTFSMLSLATAMDFNGGEDKFPHHRRVRDLDLVVSSLTASTLSRDEAHLYGAEVQSFMTRIGLPVDEAFLDSLKALKGKELKVFVEQNADHDFHGAVTYLFLASSEWIGYTYGCIYRALNCLEVSTLSYSCAYYFYFSQKLAFKNILTFSENVFSKEVFSNSADLIDYLEYRSLAMQIWGALTAIKTNFDKEDAERGLYFLRNPYSFEAILLAVAFSRDSFGFMPDIYRAKLTITFENVLDKLKGEMFILPKERVNFNEGNLGIYRFDTYFPEFVRNLESWVSQPYYGVPQEGIAALGKQPTKTILKRNGKSKAEGIHVSFGLFDEHATSDKSVEVRVLSLWEKIIDAYQKGTPLQYTLHENQRASGSWLHSYEAKGQTMDESVDAILSTLDLRKAKRNTRLYNRRGDKVHQLLRKRIRKSGGSRGKKKARKG